ncbi:MAG: rRNA maturation RNase YbeY [Planctomycetaceae bacterium]
MGEAAGIRVDVVDRQRSVRVNAAWLARVVRRALARQGVDRAEITILIVGDRRMARLHEEWLGVPGTTDVITFDLAGAGGKDGGGLRGDIVVSAETAGRVARELGWAPRHELAYYVVHGLLHLAGHDDHDPAERRAMRARERALLAAAGLPHPPRARPRGTPA